MEQECLGCQAVSCLVKDHQLEIKKKKLFVFKDNLWGHFMPLFENAVERGNRAKRQEEMIQPIKTHCSEVNLHVVLVHA